MSRITELKRRGLEVAVQRGMFTVPKGHAGQQLASAADRAARRFVEKFVGEGWTLEGRPTVRRVPMYEEHYRPCLDKKGTAVLWVPAGTGMRTDHPWFIADGDQYEVAAWFWRQPKVVKFEISDNRYNRLVRSGKLPAALKLAE